VARLKFPDGYALEAHRHDNRELVTVLSGTYRLGFGSKPDRSKTVAFPAGSYVVIPAGVPHYAFMDGPTVLQVSGDGPMDFDWKLGKK